MRWPLITIAVTAFLAGCAGGPKKDVPYVPTPDEVVSRMLTLAEVRPTDVVYDLGCGDGRIVIAAARDFGARGVGVDIDPKLIERARANAARAGVADRVEFRVADLFATDFSEATVVTLFLLPELNRRLAPTLRAMPPGTRVVSHRFDMGTWKPDVIETTPPEGDFVYLWVVKPGPATRATP